MGWGGGDRLQAGHIARIARVKWERGGSGYKQFCRSKLCKW